MRIPSWPACFSFSAVSSNALRIGGCGSTTPSVIKSPMESFFPSILTSPLHGANAAVGSNPTVSWFRMTLVNIFRSGIEWQFGPQDTLMDRFPGAAVVMPYFGTRSAEGLMPYKPLKAAGARMLPPMSEEGATGPPCMASKAPSPPEEPPEPKSVFRGLRVRPKRFDHVSRSMPVCGIVVRA